MSSPDTNTTQTVNQLNGSLFLAYTAIVTMAVVPIYIGSFLSLKRKYAEKTEGSGTEEKLTQKDAYMYPVYGSAVLFGLYVLFRLFSKEYINLLLTAYFLFFGFFALAETFTPVISHFSPELKNSMERSFQYRFPWEKDLTTVKFNSANTASWVVSLLCLVWYSLTKNWVANNLLGLTFSIQGVAFMTLGSYKTGLILLGGLFFYDIFWVFGTDVMVTVAKSFDAPIKLLFPKSFFVEKYSFSMLGLGDIVIPGIFVALLLRYDAHRYLLKKAKLDDIFPKTYFQVTIVAYTLGLVFTIFIMHTFQAAQPALLYLVPACIGASALVALFQGELMSLYSYDEDESSQNEDNKKPKGQQTPKVNNEKKNTPSKEKQQQESQQTPKVNNEKKNTPSKEKQQEVQQTPKVNNEKNTPSKEKQTTKNTPSKEKQKKQ